MSSDVRLLVTGNSSADNEGKRVKEVCAFFDERWTQSRSITDIDWSPKVSPSASFTVNRLTNDGPSG